ncbi:MAG: thioredoxin [Spirochaetia bacterium]|nr:thioredoxin [Spirochaetia bacterium]
MSKATDFTDANFDTEVTKSNIPVLVDFWAEWCGPCKMIGPMIDRIADAYAGRLKVGKVNVDTSNGTASRFGVRSIPTLMFFKNGELVEQVVGVVAEAQLKKVIEKVIA